MGGGKGSSAQSQQVQLNPEQVRTLQIQNDAMQNTFMPAYTNTVGGAKDVYNSAAGNVANAAAGASDVAGSTGNLQAAIGAGSLAGGTAGLTSLFDPQYEKNQINAALQSGREATREQLGGQNAMYGAAGGLGSSRQALADTNLRQLGEQRQATAAADAQAKVQANKAGAAGALINAGQSGMAAGNAALASKVGLASAPQDLYSKYASIVFGVPQGNTTPNYSGTQSSTGTGSSKGFKI
jgi:hypothetical protein